jgi:lactoylglutathione lyase
MKFSMVTIYVKNMEKSLSFYHELLGLDIVRRKPYNDGELAFLGIAGQPNIELIYAPDFAGQTSYSGFSVGIEVDSLEAATERMKQAGFPRIRGPVSPSPGVSFSFFHDPNGVEIELIERKR